MRDRKVIEEMVALAERFGQTIEFDEFDGRGGWCRVKGTDRVIVNQRLTPREQIRILAQVLAGYPIEEQAMPPKVRQIIEDARLELQPEPEPAMVHIPEPETDLAPSERDEAPCFGSNTGNEQGSNLDEDANDRLASLKAAEPNGGGENREQGSRDATDR